MNPHFGTLKECTEFEAVGTIYQIVQFDDHIVLQIDLNGTILQARYSGELKSQLHEQSTLAFKGKFVTAQLSDPLLTVTNVELEIISFIIKSKPFHKAPFLPSEIDLRHLSLRQPKIKAIFKIQEEIIFSFRNYLRGKGYTEIRTPKLIKDYRKNSLVSTEIHHLYRDISCGIFQKVYEIQNHFNDLNNSISTLSQWTSLNVSTGPLEKLSDLMDIHETIIFQIFRSLQLVNAKELSILNVDLPFPPLIPRLTFNEVKLILDRVYQINSEDRFSLKNLEKEKICHFIKKTADTDILFVTELPSARQHFSVMDNTKNSNLSESFELIFKGETISSGSLRIHDYEMLVSKMTKRRINPEDFEFFTDAHKFGLPPHGGFSINLELLTKKLIGLKSIDEAVMFPIEFEFN